MVAVGVQAVSIPVVEFGRVVQGYEADSGEWRFECDRCPHRGTWRAKQQTAANDARRHVCAAYAPSLEATLRALKAEKRKPDERDAPPLSRFPGPKAKALPGQLELEAEA